ncbi:hypothetical protein AX16_004458 [Volvariella volvacea WC 439]|nr:hypothetical protein AX16_004458 [Volvariella volvacea WC 439]
MLCDLMGWDFAFIFMKYGPKWRQHRKLMYQSFRPSVVPHFQPHILKSTHSFLRNLLKNPESFEYCLRHMAAELILLITYGIEVQPEHDPHVERAEKALINVAENITPGRWLVDSLPWLQYIPEWVPFAEFKRRAREWRIHATNMVELPYQEVRDDILAGRGIKSFVAEGLQAISDNENFEEWEHVVKNVAGMMYSAASDTTVFTILNGILALMCNPQVLKKAQAELDSVVRPGQLPDFKDADSLPYLAALIKETWRWGTVVPTVAHFIESEDVYKGYRIPSQSIVLANTWAISHNEEVYPDPFSFNPERFLKDGALNPEVRDPESIAFGFGRRECPGKHFASLSVWMTMACLISLFDISKSVDENGNTIEPTLEWTSATISYD